MQILKIRLSKEEQDQIFNELIKGFNDEDKRQKIELIDEIWTTEAELELYTEMTEFDENHQTSIKYRSVVKFFLTFYNDGDEVEVEDWDIDDRIKKYYEV